MPKPYLEVKHAVELCGGRTECKRCPYNEFGSEFNRWACSMHLMWDVLYWLDELEPRTKIKAPGFFKPGGGLVKEMTDFPSENGEYVRPPLLDNGEGGIW